jgi:hypothetical protein
VPKAFLAVAFAVVDALDFLAVIPEGNLLLVVALASEAGPGFSPWDTVSFEPSVPP